jgi:outer membrane lipoprotein SlyB
MRIQYISIIALLLVCGCTSNISPQTYSVGSVGQINRTVSATVITTRVVDISGTSSIGGSAGAGTGAIAGSMLGGNSIRGNIVGAIGGAIVGGLAGAAIEASATQQKGVEYIIETDNKTLMTIVQGINPIFTVGQKVFVLYGSPSRLISDPRTTP